MGTDNLFVPLGGYGRNINHDPASRAYRAARARASVQPRDVGWEVHIAPLDQGNLGRCVPTSATAMLATDPFWDTLDVALRRTLGTPATAEQYAIQAYRDVTRIDPFRGSWEPDDTGSDGLSIWKLWRDRGLVGGAEHIMSLDDAHAAIQQRPFLIGTTWLEGMSAPGADGVVRASGRSLGGHEFLCYRYDLDRDLWWCRNSWSRQWGLDGDFAFDSNTYLQLMGMQADGTSMVPTTLPAPQPVGPGPFPFEVMDTWAGKCRFWWAKYEKEAVSAYVKWRDQ